jgi:hypothetical protein
VLAYASGEGLNQGKVQILYHLYEQIQRRATAVTAA